MARVFIAEPFRRLAGGREWQDVAGSTLMEVLTRLTVENPGLRDKLLLPDGNPRAHFLIYLNDRVIRRENLKETPVQANSEVKIFTVLAGG
ncbi:MAG: MoaD/ThiS family protein [Spirochaetaceae bacterium]|nr:MAG: MoaD/ThiS family protein [Spirochaetaceae bacterium]